LPSEVDLKKEFSNSSSGAFGTAGNVFGAGRMFGGISDGGSIAAVGEGDGVGRVVLARGLGVCGGEIFGEAVVWAYVGPAETKSKRTPRRRKNFISGSCFREITPETGRYSKSG
jgi:hypothetical protein